MTSIYSCYLWWHRSPSGLICGNKTKISHLGALKCAAVLLALVKASCSRLVSHQLIELLAVPYCWEICWETDTSFSNRKNTVDVSFIHYSQDMNRNTKMLELLLHSLSRWFCLHGLTKVIFLSQKTYLTRVKIPDLKGKWKRRIIGVFHLVQMSKLNFSGTALKGGRE